MNNALLVSVESEHTETRSGIKNSKDWEMTTQIVWVSFVDPSGVTDKYPSKIQFVLAKGARPYKVGLYYLNPASFARGDYDSLSFARPLLTPVQKAA